MRILNAPMAGLVAGLLCIGGQLAPQQSTVTPLMTKIWKWPAIPDSEVNR